jgi:hypothetical protein
MLNRASILLMQPDHAQSSPCRLGYGSEPRQYKELIWYAPEIAGQWQRHEGPKVSTETALSKLREQEECNQKSKFHEMSSS